MGRRLSELTRTMMTANAELGTRMTERFNVAGALLVKLFGTPEREEREYASRARLVRDTGVKIAMNRTVFMVAMSLVAALATAMAVSYTHLDVYKRQVLGSFLFTGDDVDKPARVLSGGEKTRLSLAMLVVCLLYTSRCV